MFHSIVALKEHLASLEDLTYQDVTTRSHPQSARPINSSSSSAVETSMISGGSSSCSSSGSSSSNERPPNPHKNNPGLTISIDNDETPYIESWFDHIN